MGKIEKCPLCSKFGKYDSLHYCLSIGASVYHGGLGELHGWRDAAAGKIVAKCGCGYGGEVQKSVPFKLNIPSSVAPDPPDPSPPPIISPYCPGCQANFESGTQHPCLLFGRTLQLNRIGGHWFFVDNYHIVTQAAVTEALAKLPAHDPSLLSWDFSWK